MAPSTSRARLPLHPTRRLALCVAMLVATLVAALSTAPALGAQEQPVVAGPPLAPFAAMRVAIVPVQLWRADTTGWSKAVQWATLRLEVDSAITEELQARGLGRRWAYAGDVVRSAKRNPTYATDPYALGVGRWRSTMPKPGDQVPAVVADNLRPLTALGDTRYALVPVELRAQGEQAAMRLVLVDTRGRTVVWVGELLALAADSLAQTFAKGVADLVLEP